MTLVMANLRPRPHRCVSCGESFTSMAAATRHVDEQHSPGCRIEFVPDTQIPTESRGERPIATPAGASPVVEGGGPVPDDTLAPEGGSSAASPVWREAQRAAWIEGCIDRLHRRWPDHEVSAGERHDLTALFDELDYAASTQLVHRALVICERRPGPGELRRLQRQSGRSVGRKALANMRQTLDRGKTKR